jgi:hypothetical protein
MISLYSISSLLFNTNFPNTTKFLLDNLSININFLLTFIVSLVSGTLLTYRSTYSTLGYSDTEGIFKYFRIVSREMLTRIINVWFVDLLFSYGVISSYYLVLRYLINILFILVRVHIEYSSVFGIFNHIVFTNVSMLVYYCILEFLDRLLIYNLSIKYKDLHNFVYVNKEKEDKFIMRYVFYHVSGLSYKYSYVLNSISRSRKDLRSLISYIEYECKEVKEVLREMKEEYRKLDNKMYMTVPQVNNNINTIKKYQNYNILDKFTYKMIYKYRIFNLKTKFNMSIKYMEDINKYMNFLMKHRDYFLLLRDVSERYMDIYKDLVDEIRDVEGKCGIDLKIKI